MLKDIRTKVSSYLDLHTFEVVTKSSSSLIVKVVGMVTAFLISIYLARTIGADGLGIINLTFRIVNILIIFGMLGIMQIIIREVAIAHEEKNNEHINNVMNTAYLISGCMTLVISLVFIYLSPFLASTLFNEPRLSYPLMIALLVMLPQAFSQMFSASLIGRRMIWQSQLADQCLSLLISAFLFTVLWLNEVDLTIDITAVIYAVGRLTVTIGMGIYWKKILFGSAFNVHQAKSLYKKAYPVLIASLSLAVITNSGIIMLGVISDSRSVGLYSVATRLAELTVIIMIVVNSACSPKISSLYKQNRISELEAMLQKTTSFLFYIGLVFLTSFVFLGEYVLAVWGEEFKEAYWVLIILCFGQFINISTGAVGQLLTMTGNQKKQRDIALTCMLIVLIIMPVFIFLWGKIGAALVTAIGFASINIITLIYSQKITGIKVVRFDITQRLIRRFF